MSDTLTVEMLLEAKKLLDEQQPEKFVEVYPLAWKDSPELNELCEARIKNGIGAWETRDEPL